ncbi:MAG: iron-sulfur cluster repair di-iron protein [Flavobacteriaceae bacterium]
METLKEKTVADLVTENIKTAHIFKKHGIDFCCGGGISIERACEKKGVDYKTLEEELLQVSQSDRAYNYKSWAPEFLTDHIINVHHVYVEENSPLLLQYADKVTKVHGQHDTELVEINDLVKSVIGELAAHMKKEELILFPFIKKMVGAQKEGISLPRPAFGTVDNPITMMEEEHDHAGELFREIAELTNNYTPPAHACNTYKAFYAKLEEFENDLHLHVHLENNILFPKAKQMEKVIIK